MDVIDPAAPAAVSDEQVAALFATGEPAGRGAGLRIEREALLAGPIATALRPAPGTVFVRADLPAELAAHRALLERVLGAQGLRPLERDSALAGPVALERLGLEAARWDLWGRDLAGVFAALAGAGATATVPTQPPAPSRTLPILFRPRRRVAAALVLCLGLLGAGAALALHRSGPARPAAQVAAARRPAAAPLVTYRAPGAAFTVGYPSSWTVARSADPGVALLLVGPPASGGSMLVRVVKMAKAIDPSNMAAVKAVTDVVVNAPSVQILEQGAVTLAGLHGYYYLYTFGDGASGQQGVHSHYFLFRGSTMYTLVFQALPTAMFARLAPDFDRIAQSLRVGA